MPQKQYRVVKAEVKAIGEEANIGKISGYGSVFGVLDSYDDIVENGSFSDSLNEHGMPKMLLQHRWEDIGGVWKVAREDQKGLYLEGEINLDVQKAREYYSLIKQGAIDGLSIGYVTEDYERDQKGIRHIKKVNLMEVSIVTFPANVEAFIREVRSRSEVELPKTERELESFLRDAGFGLTQAKTIVSKGFKELIKMQRDVDDDGEMKAALQQLANTIKGVSHAGNERVN